MENNKEQLDTLNQIKGIMERSSRLTSLSGISGIAAGTVAALGTIVLCIYLKTGLFEQTKGIMNMQKEKVNTDFPFIITLAIVSFFSAMALVMFFTSRNAKKKNMIFWDAMAKRVFINQFIFLLTGGIFCMILLYYGIYFLIVPSMLIFYGLALINISKFTFNEIALLGILEICLGIFSSFVTVYPLLIWFTGFGLLHIVFGIYVYFKYEKA